jgi:phosphoribosylanthranilate isomerase
MIVKICGITNREDACAALEAGASALGFNFYPPSPRAILASHARDIAEVIPRGILKVGVFVNEDPAVVVRTMDDAGLDIAQVIGRTPVGVRTWQVHRVAVDFAPEQLADPNAEAFLLDAPSASLHGGTGATFDWRRARIPGTKIVIAGGLGPDNVATAIGQCRPWGVDACSRLEKSPGRKDHEKLLAFVRAALSV